MSLTQGIQIGFAARLFSKGRIATEEINFGGNHNFRSIQFRGREEGLSEDHLGEELGHIAAVLGSVEITPAMELLIAIDRTGRTKSGKHPCDVLIANLPAIAGLSIKYVHWHLYPIENMSEVETYQLEDALAPQFADAVSIAHRYGFRFGFENNPLDEFLLFAQPDRCRGMMEQIAGVGFVWDLNHTAPGQFSDFLLMANRMTMLHVSDTSLPDTNHHLPLGLGNIDFLPCFQLLLSKGFQGPAILEIGGLLKSGGYGRDTNEALVSSQSILDSILRKASHVV